MPRRRVLLNVASSELTLGGDSSHYRDYAQLSNEEVDFQCVPPSWIRTARTFTGRVAARACRSWEPDRLRRWLFVHSKLRVLRDEPLLRQADAVFSHLWFPDFPPGQARPVIWSSQGISPAAYYAYVDAGRVSIDDVVYLYRVLGERSAALVIHTESCAKNVVEALPQLEPKIHVIAPCVFVDPAAVRPKPSSHDRIVRFLFVGMDAERKGLREVLMAYEGVRQGTADVSLTVVSRLSPSAVEAAEARGARVMASNPGTNVRRLMAEADVFVLPTHADTYAAAAVEAMGHGCAVVISDLEPLPEVVPDGEAGFVVERKDVAGLSERMTVLACDLSLLRRLQAGARRLYTIRNDPDVVRRKLIRVVDDVVAEQ